MNIKLLRLYWNGDRSIEARAAYADYCRARYATKDQPNLVPTRRARQLLLTFESSHDAARVVDISQATAHRIMTRKVKRIRAETERKILAA